MHEAALRAGNIFPCCRQCSNQVRFELARRIADQLILPFRSGEILAECRGIREDLELAE
jgi:hypothetical protein